jgi:cytochrome b6-f complex iron-sulfur subunit
MKSNPTTDQLNRGEFLRSLGMSSAALMAFYCMGTGLTACSKSDNGTPTPTPIPTTGLTGNTETAKGAINFTIDMTTTDYSALKKEGGFFKLNDVVVANTKGNKFVAIGRYCTHENGNLDYRLTQNDFQCDFHQSEFTIEGKVKPGFQAKSDVKQYKTSLSADGNKLTVTA